ncbi:MAG: M14 family zinc carboxypeptidase [Planctomycetia bacterium]|nr:M14 family zinc carboxypeptidase [Planctomycetia bacterium]
MLYKNELFVLALCFLLCCCKNVNGRDSAWTVDIDFPGGNMIQDDQTEDTFAFHPDRRDSQVHEHTDRHWAIRVRGAEGKKLHFRITGDSIYGYLQNRGPAVSRDGGKSWDWLLREEDPANAQDSFDYTFAPDEREVLFSVQPVYTGQQIDLLLADLQGKPIRKEILCKTDKGREAELLRFGNPGNSKRVGVVLMSRTHSNETWGSWTLDGLIREIFSGSPEGDYLLANADFFVVPLMDKDGVEDGDQGKMRLPHDHNRDFDKDRYPTVRELKKQVVAWGEGKRLIGFDFHSGTLDLRCAAEVREAGWAHDYLFFCVNKSKEEEERRFGQFLLERQKNGFAVYTARCDAASDRMVACSDGWMATVQDVNFLVGPIAEVPAVHPDGRPQSVATARELGANFAKALADYIQSLPDE